MGYHYAPDPKWKANIQEKRDPCSLQGNGCANRSCILKSFYLPLHTDAHAKPFPRLRILVAKRVAFQKGVHFLGKPHLLDLTQQQEALSISVGSAVAPESRHVPFSLCRGPGATWGTGTQRPGGAHLPRAAVDGPFIEFCHTSW